jgi:tight adherence protein B
MTLFVALLTGALVAAVLYLAAPELAEGLGRYESWVASELGGGLKFLNIDLHPRVARYLVRALGGLGFLLGTSIAFNPIAGVFFGAGFAAAPVPFSRFLKARRWAAFDSQLLDGINLIGNGLKSGLDFQAALQVLVREMRPPISEEFDQVLKEVRVGRTLDDALLAMNQRMEHPELDLMVTSVVALRRRGGRLSETFEIISETISERTRIEGKIRAMTAMGMTQLYILIGVPYLLAFMMYAMMPDYMGILFRTLEGYFVIFLVSALVAMAWYSIKRIVTIEV